MSKFRKSKFLLKGCAFAVAPVVLSGSAPQSVNALFSIEDFKEWWKSFEDLIKKLFAGKSEKINDSSEVVEQNKILSNSANENGIVKNLLGEKYKWEFDENTGKHSTVYKIYYFGDVFVSVEPCSTAEGMYTIKLSVNKSKDYGSENGEKEVVKEFNISSVNEADAVKNYLEERVIRTQKLKETLEKCDFKWKRNSSKTSSLVLPSNFELKLDSDEGGEYVVSNVEYDFVESAFKVYSQNFDSGKIPFLICSDEKEIDSLLEKIVLKKRNFDYDLITKAAENLYGVLDYEKWTYDGYKLEYKKILNIEGIDIPLYIKPSLFEYDDGKLCTGYRVGCFAEPYGNFFCSKNFGDEEKEKLTMAVNELTSFIKFFKDLEKTDKFGQVQFSEYEGFVVKATSAIDLGVCFQYSDEVDLKGLTLAEQEQGTCFLDKITYVPNLPGAKVSFLLNGEYKSFLLSFNVKDEKEAFDNFVKNLEHVVSNKNEVASKEQISGSVGQSNL